MSAPKSRRTLEDVVAMVPTLRNYVERIRRVLQPRPWKALPMKEHMTDKTRRILEDCTRDEFFQHPENRHPRTRDFLDEIPQALG